MQDLVSLVMEVVFSGGLKRPDALPYFIETMARQWNQAPLQPTRGICIFLIRLSH